MAPSLAPILSLTKIDMCSELVGMAGFEPAASCSQSRRANQAAPHPAGPFRSLPLSRRALRSSVRPCYGYAVDASPAWRRSPRGPGGRSSMAEPQPSKLVMRVRFPSPAPTENRSSAARFRDIC
jgi:hypothetical protein